MNTINKIKEILIYVILPTLICFTISMLIIALAVNAAFASWPIISK